MENPMSEKIYQFITERILEHLKVGTIPWRKPWNSGSAPKNFKTGKEYRGINVLILNSAAYGSPYWLTYLQAREMSGVVRRGEKGYPIVFWKLLKAADVEDAAERRDIPVLRYYTVFNLQQIDGISAPEVAKAPDFHPIENAENIVRMQHQPAIRYGFSKAFYRPSIDTIHLPNRCVFESTEEYYSVFFHELTHATGHASRLNRFQKDSLVAPFGSPEYSNEELVAEIGAAFLCAQAGIEQATLKNSAAYIQGWLKALENDHRLILHAAGQAQKAADFILGESNPEVEHE
jgi:antirestriction protein ArdC